MLERYWKTRHLLSSDSQLSNFQEGSSLCTLSCVLLFQTKTVVFMLHPVYPKDDKIDNASSVGLSMSLSMHRMITERFVSEASPDFEYSWIQAAAEETRILEVICRFDVLISHSKMFCGSSIVEKSEELGGLLERSLVGAENFPRRGGEKRKERRKKSNRRKTFFGLSLV
ncbi:unnamed protein product [Camellia sinensis]